MTCIWEPDAACLDEEWTELDEADQERALMLATSSLQALTLNRVGTCPIKVRPCPEERSCTSKKWDWHPYPIAPGQWLNGCGCSTAHYCGVLSEIDLDGPVGYVSEIKVDGVALDLTDDNWRLDDGHLLVWQGTGDSPIPDTQDLNKPDTEPGTWSISYSKSYPVNADARLAVAYLAAEFAEACKPQGDCSLPRGVTSVVRNGVTFSIEAGLFPNGLTGIDIVDQFILKWVPPGSPTKSAQVFNPRKRKARRTTAMPTAGPGTGFGAGAFGE